LTPIRAVFILCALVSEVLDNSFLHISDRPLRHFLCIET
jgi:hypothetical protein